MIKRLPWLIAACLVLLWLNRATERLSTDALGMLIGMAFGLLGLIPAALMIVVSGRREAEPPRPYAPPPQPLSTFEVVETPDGALYAYDRLTGSMKLIQPASKMIEVKK